MDTDYSNNPCNGPKLGDLAPIECYQGECRALVDACDDLGLPASCPAFSPKAKDQCNDNLDNDCDGQVDEDDCECGQDGDIDTSKPCYTGSVGTRKKGMCQDGIQFCELGVWGQCDGAVVPTKEICDQLDNDCDGEVDEGCPCTVPEQLCYGGPVSTVGIGECKQGFQQCINGVWGDCLGDITPKNVELCDGMDSDCDGQLDTVQLEDCECVPGDTLPCYTGQHGTENIGACHGGHYECVDNKFDTDHCIGEVTPVDEECNGEDDDCDGFDDSQEDLPLVGEYCETTFPGPCAAGKYICTTGGIQCDSNIDPGDDEEVCNTKDDDCNGTVNDGFFCCPNEVQDGNETWVDCGGECPAGCPDHKPCKVADDCESGVCQGGEGAKECVPAECDDHVKNGDEGDIDCGGSDCAAKCVVGDSCNDAVDCVTNLCISHVCSALDPGSTCHSDDECLTHYCVDGFCCDSRCGGTCQACSSFLKGFGQNGVCGAIVAGQDPEDECAVEPKESCGRNGVCNGFGQCQRYGSDTTCVPVSCSLDTNASNRADTCDGSGICVDMGLQSCSPYTCNSQDGKCRTMCTSHLHCADDFFCSNNECIPAWDIGHTCLTNNECVSRHCSDGFCCSDTCNEPCRSCKAQFTGKSNGICDYVIEGTDPEQDCAAAPSGSCGQTGLCNSVGQCALATSGTQCNPAVCINQTTLDQADTCNGTGTCVSQDQRSCGHYTCDPVAAACRSSCQVQTDCAPAYYCSGNTCVDKLSLGSACSADVQCTTSHCVDGVCCETDCQGICFACSASKKGAGLDGYCGSVIAGKDDDNECTEQSPSTCGYTGFCNGAGACQRYQAGTDCVPPQCGPDGVTRFNPDTCDGNGTCVDGGSQSCVPYTCQGTACTLKKILGSPCDSAVECASGFCADRVCCDSACSGTCFACTGVKKHAGADGYCLPVVAGFDDDDDCAQQPASTCGFTGACNGSGSCQQYTSGSVCNPATCATDGITLLGADTCNGSGTCVDNGSVNCAPFICDVDHCSQTKKTIGASCVNNGECASGACVDDVCCGSACSGPCQACSSGKKGGGADGVCGSIAAGTDPDNECTQDPVSTCGRDGTCDGVNACRRYVSGTVCNAAACAGPTTVSNPDTCNGSGVCVDGGTTSCGQQTCAGGACSGLLVDGASCAQASQCASGFCVDGFCCGTACNGPCQACSNAAKGSGPDGVCGPIAAGTDPDNDCAQDPVSTCGRDGTCDGANACRRYVSGTVCNAAACAGPTTVSNPDTCNGSGACNDGGTTNCGQETCAGGACSGLLVDGTSCAQASQCASGFCVDGFCCGTACNGPCQACSNATKGSGANGVCGSIAAGTDPDDECAQDPSATCGQDGTCDGANACRRYGSSTVCNAAGCAGPTTVSNPDTCNGAGSCQDGGTTSCGNFTCESGVCTTKKVDGSSCTQPSECNSGFCVDGVCCETSCAGACAACSTGKKGYGANGICQPIAAGADPDDECVQDPLFTCNHDGTCDGFGACRLYPLGTICIQGGCADTTIWDAADTCDGAGTCVVTSQQDCWPFACDDVAGGCWETCTVDAQCASGAYCGGTQCQAKKSLGDSCGGAGECQSGFCADDVCCDSACNGSCEACTSDHKGAGFDGECGLALSGTECASAVCAGDGVTLNLPDTCAGDGACNNGGTQNCAPYTCAVDACLTTCTNDMQCAPGAYCSSTNHCLRDAVLILGGGSTMVGAALHPGSAWTATSIPGGAPTDGVALTIDSTGRGVGLMHDTGASNALRYTTWNPLSGPPETWASFLQVGAVTTGAKPAIASASSTSQAAYQQAAATSYLYAGFSGSWSPTAEATSASGVSTRAAAIAVVPSSGNAGLVYVNGNTVLFRERASGVWGSAATLFSGASQPNTAPTIAATTGGSATLMAVYTDSAGRMFSRTRVGTSWTAAAQIGSNSFTTATQVALAALTGGTAVVAYRSSVTATSGRLYTSFYNGSSWSTPAEYSASFTIVGTPAVARGVGADSTAAAVELAYIQTSTNRMNHTRCTAMTGSVCSTWSTPVQVSTTTVSTVAIASSP